MISEPKQQAITENYSQYLVDLTKNVPDPLIVFKVNDQVILTQSNISLIKAKRGKAKTFVSSIFAAAYLALEKIICGISAFPLPGKPGINLIDTEQSVGQVYRVIRRIHRMAGIDPTKNSDKLKAFHIQQISSIAERKELVKLACQDPRAGLIIVDGIRDLLLDFNDVIESTKLAHWLLQLASENQCHIIVILHENKGLSTDSRGHLGSEIENKAETVFRIEKNNDVFTVLPDKTRNAPFEPFSFTINDLGLPESAEKPDTTNKIKEFKEIFKNILVMGCKYHKDLVQAYQRISNKSERTAKEHIRKALEQGIIVKSGDLYSLKTDEED